MKKPETTLKNTLKNLIVKKINQRLTLIWKLISSEFAKKNKESGQSNGEFLRKAINEYKQSLRYNPNDNDARYNLSYATKLIQNQENKDKQNKDQEKKDQQNKDQENKDQEKKDQQNKDQENKDQENKDQEKKDQQNKDQEKKDQQNKDQEKKDQQSKEKEQNKEEEKN